jgi:putative acetyltransferase
MSDRWRIRHARADDLAALLALWERSVRATHAFLTEADIVELRPLVEESLSGDALELWVLTETGDAPIGFMGLAGNDIAALFLEPACRGQGGGRMFVSHAQTLRAGELTVDVNEQNSPGPRLLRGAGLRRHRPLTARRRRPAVPLASPAPRGAPRRP